MDGVSVLGAEYLMLFKMKAWLDLRQKKAERIHVNERDLKKHKNDVFRLFPLADPTAQVEVSPAVAADIRQFTAAMEQEPVDSPRLGLTGVSLSEICDALEKMITLAD